MGVNFKMKKNYLQKEFIERGDLLYINLGGKEKSIGSEQYGKRYAICLQNDIGNTFSPTIIVAFCTSQIKTSLPTHVDIGKIFDYSTKDTTVLLEQIRTIDKQRIIHNYGQISKKYMNKINESLKISLGLF